MKDYIKLSAVVTPNQVEITGPISKLALVSSVVVPINIDEANDDVTVFVAPQMLDSLGNEVSGLTISNNQIQVKVPIQQTKSIPASVVTAGELSENFRLISMELGVKNVIIRGEDEDIANINKLVVDGIVLTEMTDETTVMPINLAGYLPEGVYIYGATATTDLTIDIEPIIISSYIVSQDDLSITQIPEGLQFRFLVEEPYVISFEGIYQELSELKVEDMLPRISLKDLDVGIHEVPLELFVPSGFKLNSELPVVQIELTESTDLQTPASNTNN